MPSRKISFYNSKGVELSARLELPLLKPPYPFAIFAHVFTGSKSHSSVRHISRALNMNGIAVFRFDFTGLGQSGGDFAETNFSSNVDDLFSAAQYLEKHFEAPSFIIGQSLGGAASVFAASMMESVKAIATIGAPAEPEHVTRLLSPYMDEILNNGEANVKIDGRDFVIKKQFIDDLKEYDMYSVLENLNKAILVLHSPQDTVVAIKNAAKIYHAAKHPKSFVTLDGANHMLSDKNDAYYAGNVISSWVKRYLPDHYFEEEKITTHKQVVCRLEDEGFTTEIIAGKHGLLADESEDVGGNDFGPSPYEILNSSLGACTAMTIQMYARRKKWPLEEVRVHLAYSRSYKEDCDNCTTSESKLDHFERVIELKGPLDKAQKERLLEIANKCPVHRTLSSPSYFKTELLE
jgi:putative redox protein